MNKKTDTMNYRERPRKGGGTEACLNYTPNGLKPDALQVWHRLMPITFTAKNAQKVFDGTKTQTRRLMSPQPWGDGYKHSPPITHFFDKGNGLWWGVSRGIERSDPSPAHLFEIKARYRVGDVLWVQEPWRVVRNLDRVRPLELPLVTDVSFEGDPVSWGDKPPNGKLRPGRFMPLRLARPARYEVIGVKAERVTSISEEDAKSEGCKPYGNEFRDLWNSIHAKPGTRFEDAPWVFAYTFKRITKSGQ